jgi:hypothetical protein
MASATRVQVVAKEGETALEVTNKVAAVEVAKVASAMTHIGKSPSSAQQNGGLEGCNPLLTVTEIPPEGLSEFGSKVADVAVVAKHVASPQVPSPLLTSVAACPSMGPVVVIPMTQTKRLER